MLPSLSVSVTVNPSVYSGCRQREVEIGRRVRIESYILRAGHRDGGADELCGTFAGSEIEAAGSQIAFRDFEVSGNGFSALPDSITDAIDASPVTPMRSNPPIFLIPARWMCCMPPSDCLLS